MKDNKFTNIMKLVEQYPNDMELGEKVREIYWNNRKVEDPNQLKIEFPVDPVHITDTDIESFATRSED